MFNSNVIGLGAMLSFGVKGIRQVEQASNSLDKLKDKVDETDNAVKKFSPKQMMAAGGAITGIGLSGAFALRKATISASEFQKAMAQVKGVTGADEETMRGLTRAAEEMVLKTGRAPVETAQAMYELASAGGSVESVLKGAEPVLDLAALGELSVADAAKSAIAGVSAFGMTADKTRYLVDLLAASSRVSMVHMNEFPMVLGQMASAGQLAGYSAGQTVAAFSLMRNSAGTAQQATETLRQTLRGLATATSKEAIKAQQEIGKVLGRNFSVFDASTGKVRGLVGIVADLAEAYEKANPEQKVMMSQQLQQIANMGGITGIMKMMSATVETNTGEVLKGADALRWMEKQMENVSGESEAFAKTIKAEWGFFRTWMQNMGELFLVKFGQPLIEMLNKHIRPALEKIMKSFAKFLELHPNLIKFAAGFTLIATSIALVVGPLMMAKGAFLMLEKMLGVTVLTLLKSTILSFRGLFVATQTASTGFWTLNAAMLPLYIKLMLVVGAIWAMIRAWNTWKVPRAESQLRELASESDRIHRNIKLYKEQFEAHKMSASMYQEKMKGASTALDEIEKKNKKLGGFMEAYSESWQFKTPSEIVKESLKAQKEMMDSIKGTTDGTGDSYEKLIEKIMKMDDLVKGSIERNTKIVSIDLTKLGASIPAVIRMPTKASMPAPAMATTVARTTPVTKNVPVMGGGESRGYGAEGSWGKSNINIEKVEIKYQKPITQKEGEDTWRYIKEAMEKDAAASGWPAGKL